MGVVSEGISTTVVERINPLNQLDKESIVDASCCVSLSLRLKTTRMRVRRKHNMFTTYPVTAKVGEQVKSWPLLIIFLINDEARMTVNKRQRGRLFYFPDKLFTTISG